MINSTRQALSVISRVSCHLDRGVKSVSSWTKMSGYPRQNPQGTGYPPIVYPQQSAQGAGYIEQGYVIVQAVPYSTGPGQSSRGGGRGSGRGGHGHRGHRGSHPHRPANSRGAASTSKPVMSEELENRYKYARRKYTYFWKRRDVFSQWHPSEFTCLGGIKFTCAEQYMMYQKAILLGNDDIARKILRARAPSEMKALGRQVKRFKDDVWLHNCIDVVKNASIEKFKQNKHLKEQLFDTYPTILAEASPSDKIWGIGLPERDERAWNMTTWEGLNLLGYILTEVREELMYKERHITKESVRNFTDGLKKKLTKQNLEDDEGTNLDDETDAGV